MKHDLATEYLEETMETIRSEKIVAELDNLEFGYWDDDASIMVTDKDEVMSALGLDVLAYDAIEMFIADIKEKIGKDLKDIWEWLELLDRKAHE